MGGGGSGQPYLYDPPAYASRQSVAYPYSDFNPRAATQAHYAEMAARAERQRAKAQQGNRPLINFNEHPDSYLVVNTKTIEHKPMSRHTKRNVKAARGIQLALRILQDVGAIGLLVCVICLKMNMDAIGWVLRIAPAYDIIVSTYAVYHLFRSAKGRTPASSASYHMFALFMDAGLIPFYVFMAIYANQSYSEPAATPGRWTSFFNSDTTTTALMLVTFVASAAIGGLHLVSIALDLCLVLVFRRISNLPPDMNPLEDNLTSRKTRTKRHKHKTSSLTGASSVSDEVKDKHHLSVESIPSVHSFTHRPAAKKPTDERTMPFMHSRMQSSVSFSPHNPESARLSRQNLAANVDSSSSPLKQSGGRNSPHALAHPDSDSAEYQEPELQPAPLRRFSGSGSWIANALHTDNPSSAFSSRKPNGHAASNSQTEQLLDQSNWMSLEDDEAADVGFRQPISQRSYAPIPAHHDDVEDEYENEQPLSHHHERHDSFEPQPLKMNPPTPPPGSDESYTPGSLLYHQAAARLHDRTTPAPLQPHSQYPEEQDALQRQLTTRISRAATAASDKTFTSSVYSDSASSLGGGAKTRMPGTATSTISTTPKGKYYGDLASATRAVRRAVTPEGGFYNLPPSPDPQSIGYGFGGLAGDGSSGRVVSRTGVDIADGRDFYGGATGAVDEHVGGGAGGVGLRDRRQVSGKVAEEGRAGAGWARRMF